MTEAHDELWLESGIQLTRIFCFVAATLLIYDHLCTLDREIELVWKRRLGRPAAVLFLLNRYAPYSYVFFTIRDYWSTAQSQNDCRHRDIATFAILAIGLFSSELILMLRTWAIWNKSRIILGLFVALGCAKIGVLLLAIYHMFHFAHYINISPTGIFCISPVLGGWSWETLCFMMTVILETSFAILTLAPTVQARKSSSSRWLFNFLYMGIIYYFYTLLTTSVNMVLTVNLRNIGSLPLPILQGVIQSTLCSRVIFLARSSTELAMAPGKTSDRTTTRMEILQRTEMQRYHDQNI